MSVEERLAGNLFTALTFHREIGLVGVSQEMVLGCYAKFIRDLMEYTKQEMRRESEKEKK